MGELARYVGDAQLGQLDGNGVVAEEQAFEALLLLEEIEIGHVLVVPVEPHGDIDAAGRQGDSGYGGG